MPSLTADLVVNHNLYTKSQTNGYDGTFSNIKYVFAPGLIGNIYSYIDRPDGLYWMGYANSADYSNFNPTYIKHEPGKLYLPDEPDIWAKLIAEQDAKDLASKGILQYNIEKYAPYVIGALVVAIGLPSLITLFNRKK